MAIGKYVHDRRIYAGRSFNHSMRICVTHRGTAKNSVFSIWKTRYTAVQLVIFSVIGMVGLQYTFVKTIEVSDAIVATLLQFLAPIFIILYTSIKYLDLAF